jgi:hypothetical protein
MWMLADHSLGSSRMGKRAVLASTSCAHLKFLKPAP